MAIDLDKIKQDYHRAEFARSGHTLMMLSMHIPPLIAEINRLRAELTTTLVACERCGRGVPPKWLVDGMCPGCATSVLKALRKSWHSEHDERGCLVERYRALEKYIVVLQRELASKED